MVDQLRGILDTLLACSVSLSTIYNCLIQYTLPLEVLFVMVQESSVFAHTLKTGPFKGQKRIRNLPNVWELINHNKITHNDLELRIIASRPDMIVRGIPKMGGLKSLMTDQADGSRPFVFGARDYI